MKKAVVIVSVALVLALSVLSVRSAMEFSEPVRLQFMSSSRVPVRYDAVNGLSLSGWWEGPGFAQVWLEGEGKQYLVVDTRRLTGTVEFAGFGARFEQECVQSCDVPVFRPGELAVFVSAPGVLSLDEVRVRVPEKPQGMMVAPVDGPNHSFVLLGVLLLVGIVGAHWVSRHAERSWVKRVLAGVFTVLFLSLLGVLGASFASPTSGVVAVAKGSASVMAALGLIALLVLGVLEIHAKKKYLVSIPSPDVWDELEEAEKGIKRK